MKMKKAAIKGGQLVTSMNNVQMGGNNQGRGFQMANPTPINMGVGKGSKKGGAGGGGMKTKRTKAY